MNIKCIEGTIKNSHLFGKSLAIGADWIAIGDPGAGLVHIFDKRPPHLEIEVIKSPELGEKGFGFTLSAGANALFIGAYSKDGSIESGAVYRYEFYGQIHEIARSDTKDVIGFSLAAEQERVVFGRRSIGERFVADGTVTVIGPTGRHDYLPDGYKDYFGQSVDVSGDVLVSAAPAIGVLGSLWLAEIKGGETQGRLLTVPEEFSELLQRRDGPVALSEKACVLSGDSGVLPSQSMAWIGCDPERTQLLDAQGDVDAAEMFVVFSGVNGSYPDWGLEHSIRLFRLNDAEDGFEFVDLANRHIKASPGRSVALSPDMLLIGAYAGQRGSRVYVMDPREINLSETEITLSCN
ncbi:hypothetical protein MAA8898_00452 [Maliponia aquimaris]|uniref:DUF3616 domain-containing protein n=2 Tax=Maliponia aquimaris TaxID=1673631 RepID=A0A238JSD2_9RHOB|nr:hypothetical protein MAA8898_00452 [Maliponia aquimaris]